MKNNLSIYDFTNTTTLLDTIFGILKSNNPDFSVRKWAQVSGVKPEVLLEVLKGKKSTSIKLLNNLLSQMELTSNEQSYLEVMVRFTNAEAEAEKHMFKLVMEDLKPHKVTEFLAEDESIFSHWSYMAIFVLAGMENFECTEESISKLLIEDVPVSILKSGIKKLIAAKMISSDSNGFLRKNVNHVASQNDVKKETVHKYYEQVFDLAKEHIQTPVDEREFQCVTISLNSEELDLFKNEIRKFRSKLVSLGTSSTDQVYQLNIQLFPLSRKLDVSQMDTAVMN